MTTYALIERPVERLAADFGLSAVVAPEIEFYLHGGGAYPADPRLWQDIAMRCKSSGIPLLKHEKEKGAGQYEVALHPAHDAVRTARDTIALKEIVFDVASFHGLHADFSARPVASEPGSGLHIHVHLENRQGQNSFQKDDATISNALKYSIGGLLCWLPDCMPVFAPTNESYGRFTAGTNAPTTISWGANNRTVAIRLPDKPSNNKHIEHRVSGADADPVRVIAVILAAIHYGLQNNIEPGEQIFGDAALPMYNLPKFPLSLEEGLDRMNRSGLFTGYFSASDLWPSRG